MLGRTACLKRGMLGVVKTWLFSWRKDARGVLSLRAEHAGSPSSLAEAAGKKPSWGVPARAGGKENSPRRPDPRAARRGHDFRAAHAGSLRASGGACGGREGAQGWPEGAGGRLVPVLARLTPEEVVELLHAGGRDGVGLHAGERQACPLDDAHEAALGLLHLARGGPRR